MGIPVTTAGEEDNTSPGTVLSKASTAPPSAKSVYAVQELEEIQHSQDGNNMSQEDPPEEEAAAEEERGLDPDEEDVVVDKSSSQLLNAKSSGNTPDMENSMEEMVERYDDEFDGGDDKDSGGFELNTQEEVGFDNEFGGFDDGQQEEEEVRFDFVRLFDSSFV